MELEGHLNYLKAIVENLNDMIWVINVGQGQFYQIAYANPAALKATGSDKDLIGMQVADATSSENYERIAPLYEKVTQDREIIEQEICLATSIGDKYLDVKLVPVLNAVGDCAQIISISREVKGES